jgi:hypothetical protein
MTAVSLKSYISDETATIPSSKCSVCHAHKCFTSRRMINSFVHSRGFRKNISLLQGHVHLPLPPWHYCHNPNDHHTNCLCWKRHVWQACYSQIRKNQTWHPSQHLAISSSHKSTTLAKFDEYCTNCTFHRNNTSCGWVAQLVTNNKVFLLYVEIEASGTHKNPTKLDTIIHTFLFVAL